MKPATKVSTDYQAGIERIRGMIARRQGSAGVAGAARDITRTFGVDNRTARRMQERPETLNLHDLAILLTWLGQRIQFKTVTEPPPLEALTPSRPKKAKRAPGMDPETWKAWVEENRRQEATRGAL